MVCTRKLSTWYSQLNQNGQKLNGMFLLLFVGMFLLLFVGRFLLWAGLIDVSVESGGSETKPPLRQRPPPPVAPKPLRATTVPPARPGKAGAELIL